ncbi:MAG: manganese efflux pump [Desulfobacter sp.]|nr:manganese efflux pump [Desulfobacter sp.]WDP83826.1 MAG: manganese efflux pump [Desulfobacter sp.]
MGFLDIILVAVGLGMDAAAVSMAAAAAGFARDYRAVFRLAFHFGLFQFMMPVVGWFFGQGFADHVRGIDHWIAFVLLAFVGGRMIRSGLDQTGTLVQKDPSKGLTMVMLSFATSIDALAVGLSLAMLEINIWYPSMIIGGVTAAMSLGAIAFGQRLGLWFGKKMEIFGGLLLVCIGIRILVLEFAAG